MNYEPRTGNCAIFRLKFSPPTDHMRILALISLIIACSFNAYAAARTWDGGGIDSNWQTAANWVGDAAPVAGDDLIFPAGAAQLATNNNFFLLTNFNSITFGDSYTIGGNPFRVGAGGITVTAGTQAINTAITLNGGQTFTSATGTTTTIAVLSLGTAALRIDGGGSFGIGLISGTGLIEKLGGGASLIAAASGFSGPIFIGGGILVVDASIPGSNIIIEAPNGGLGGTGTVGGVSSMLGSISAGTLTSPTGLFNTGNLFLSGNTNYLCKIGGTTPGTNGHDQINVTGTVQLTSPRLAPVPWNGFRPAIGDAFTILRNDGSDPINGQFFNAPEGATFAGPLNTAFRISYVGGDGNDIVVTRVSRAAFDFDGDGKTDIGVFKPQTGIWSRILSGDGSQSDQHFGSAGDRIAPADYDGDNRTDIAVFRPSDGTWYIFNSFTATVTIRQFGASGDMPIPNDFDGDGRSDIAVWRPTTGVWYELRTLLNDVFIQQFGTTGDIPQLVDFDGDGIGDLSVFRPGDGTWHFWQSSTSSYVAFPFGISTDTPVPADYNGDGRTDAAVFRASADPNQPDFYILLSGPFTFEGASWGVPGDLPVVGDYDGDGRADIAIFRPGSAINWFLLRSTSGLATAAFGDATDKPIPGAYTP